MGKVRDTSICWGHRQRGRDTAWSHLRCCNTCSCPEQHYQRFVFCFSYSKLIYINYEGDAKYSSTKFRLDGGLVQPDLVADWVVGMPAHSRGLELCGVWSPCQPKPFCDWLVKIKVTSWLKRRQLKDIIDPNSKHAKTSYQLLLEIPWWF